MKGLPSIFRRNGSVAVVPSDNAARSSRVCPFIDVLKQVPVNGFQMCGVETSGRPLSDLYLDKPALNVLSFGHNKRIAAGRSQLVFERLSVGEGISGQSSGMEV
jgi:hypothetical protein